MFKNFLPKSFFSNLKEVSVPKTLPSQKTDIEIELEPRTILSTLEKIVRKSTDPYKEDIFNEYEDREAILNKLVIVRYWKKKNGPHDNILSIDSTGHVSLQTRQHYISFYPDENGLSKEILYDGVDGHLVEIQTDYSDKQHGEGRPPEEVFLLFDLDVDKINHACENYSNGIKEDKGWKWAAYGSSAINKPNTTNCVKLTATLLAIGGLDILKVLPFSHISTSQIGETIKQYGQKIPSGLYPYGWGIFKFSELAFNTVLNIMVASTISIDSKRELISNSIDSIANSFASIANGSSLQIKSEPYKPPVDYDALSKAKVLILYITLGICYPMHLHRTLLAGSALALSDFLLKVLGRKPDELISPRLKQNYIDIFYNRFTPTTLWKFFPNAAQKPHNEQHPKEVLVNTVSESIKFVADLNNNFPVEPKDLADKLRFFTANKEYEMLNRTSHDNNLGGNNKIFKLAS